jgi:hypothetical protein
MRLRCVVLSFPVLLALVGASWAQGPRLRDEARLKMAKAALEQFNAIDIDAIVKPELERLAEWRDGQIEGIRRFHEAQWQRQLAIRLSDESAAVRRERRLTEARLLELVGSISAEELENWAKDSPRGPDYWKRRSAELREQVLRLLKLVAKKPQDHVKDVALPLDREFLNSLLRASPDTPARSVCVLLEEYLFAALQYAAPGPKRDRGVEQFGKLREHLGRDGRSVFFPLDHTRGVLGEKLQILTQAMAAEETLKARVEQHTTKVGNARGDLRKAEAEKRGEVPLIDAYAVLDGLVSAAGKAKEDEQWSARVSEAKTQLAALPKPKEWEPILKGLEDPSSAEFGKKVEELDRKVGEGLAGLNGVQATSLKFRRALRELGDPLRGMQDAGESLEDAGVKDLDLLGRLRVLDQRLSDVNSVLDALIRGKAEPSEEADKELVLAVRVAASVGILTKLLRRPDGSVRLSPLLLEAGRLEAERERLSKRLSHAQGTLLARDTEVEAILLEAHFLARARCSASSLGDETRLDDVNEDSRRDLREELYCIGMARMARGEQHVSRERVRYLDQKRALELDAAALKQWRSMLSVPLSQIVAYYDGGIRGEDLATILALVVVAVGVIG